MSEFGFEIDHKLNTSRAEYSVEDIYNITRGTFNEFSLKGYSTPRTAIPLSKEYRIPVDKNRDIFASIKKKANDPNSTTYALDNEKILSKYWYKPSGGFHTGRRHTVTEDAIKKSSKIPGPGAYMPIPKGEYKENKDFLLGKFE